MSPQHVSCYDPDILTDFSQSERLLRIDVVFFSTWHVAHRETDVTTTLELLYT